jgi:hypothetical protein
MHRKITHKKIKFICLNLKEIVYLHFFAYMHEMPISNGPHTVLISVHIWLALVPELTHLGE